MAHNAGFDIAFLDAELNRAAKPAIAAERVVDTLALVQRKHPGGHNTLDDLCARYDVDRSHRSKHGALLDAELRETHFGRVQIFGDELAFAKYCQKEWLDDA